MSEETSCISVSLGIESDPIEVASPSFPAEPVHALGARPTRTAAGFVRSFSLQSHTSPKPRLKDDWGPGLASHFSVSPLEQMAVSASPSRPVALSLRGEIFHTFISYRVKSESDLVGELYHKLMMSAEAAKIPDISKWPSKFKEPPREVASSRLHVFWDAKCLAPGVTWKDNGFVTALSSSLVFIPLLSDGVVEKWFEPVEDFVDNVLLELVLALEFNLLSEKLPTDVFPCKYIMPVFVNDLFKRLSDLSPICARETMKEAVRILGAFGITLSRDYSPRSVLAALGAFQGVEMHIYHHKLRQQALELVVKEALTAVTMCIQGSAFFIDDFVAHHPRARELCDWLQTHNMSGYTGVIARHGITSVYALSLLDVSSAVPALAEDCALCCGESHVQAIASLSRAIALAKSSHLSLALSIRCNRFVDAEASVLSAVYSSCGVDTMLAKPQFLVLVLFIAFFCLAVAVFTIRIVEQPFLSVSFVVNPLFWFMFSLMCVCLATWPFAFGGSIFNIPSTEFKPRKIAATFFMLFSCTWTVIVIFIKSGFYETIEFSHSIMCTTALRKGTLTVSFDACYMYELFFIYLVQFAGSCLTSASIYFRQELAWRVFLVASIFIASAFLGFNEILLFDNHLLLRVTGVIVLFVVTANFVGFETFNVYSKKKASKLLKDDEMQYNLKWSNLMLKKFGGSNGSAEATALSEYIRESFREVLDDMSGSLLSNRPTVLQEHSSIDILFEDVECVDVAFQELLECWLKGSSKKEILRFVQEQDLAIFSLSGIENLVLKCRPGPVKQITRAISKTTRTYRGDFRRLTDLVRSTIVFQNFADIRFFLQLFHEHALCCPDAIDPKSFRRVHRSHADVVQAGSLHIMQIIRVRNRFDPSLSSKQLFGGYRDLALKIKMGFICVQSNSVADRVKFVPVCRWGEASVKKLVFEIQLHLDDMQLSDDADESNMHHHLYVESRNLLSV